MTLYLLTRKLSPRGILQIFASRYANLSASIVRYVIGYTSRDSQKPLSYFNPNDFYDPESLNFLSISYFKSTILSFSPRPPLPKRRHRFSLIAKNYCADLNTSSNNKHAIVKNRQHRGFLNLP